MRIKVKLTNRTDYNTRDLSAIVRAGLKAHGLEVCTVHVRYRRGGSITCGRARIGWKSSSGKLYPGSWMELYLNRPPFGPTTDGREHKASTVGLVASTVDHECYHLRGVRHRQFPKHARYCVDGSAPWQTSDLQLRLKETSEPVIDLDKKRADKLTHALLMLAKAKSRTRRATTILKRWVRRVKAIEKTIAIAAAKKESGHE